ncbi:putative SAUR-like auxin-responsive protein family [Tripterygium wilfordii]|uniref:Putative SAUR-like auxin-responsive protein family n=1 Tax=Tripterygium wilfordii TaxID=458696 RepID=A0A7J7DEJ1_TRIWF|nr:auxin-responsive protein SAUR50 [Tripterygium wilfordii]KAF5744743.1 putative SAUR-like auxin-responsive protein family [Tripterygium wilfordii]
MGKLRTNGKKNGFVKLKAVAKMLHKSLILGRKSNYVPEDVKEGHFAVIAEEGDEPRRFVVPISFLTHPVFLRLLEQAAEEYGFNRDGALTIPCLPSELEKILGEQHWEENGDCDDDDEVDVNCGSHNAIQSC